MKPPINMTACGRFVLLDQISFRSVSYGSRLLVLL